MEGHFMRDINPLPQKETRPQLPPEVQRMYQKILSAGLRVIAPTLKNNYEKTLLRIALKHYGGRKAA
jgi:hypothetical protein